MEELLEDVIQEYDFWDLSQEGFLFSPYMDI